MTAPARIGLAIDEATNDLFVAADGSLAVVRDAEAVGQHARQRLLTYQGEWFLDTVAGVPWIQEIFAKRYDPALAEAVVKSVLLETDGIVSIDTFSIRFDKTSRGILIRDVAVTTDYDERAQV